MKTLNGNIYFLLQFQVCSLLVLFMFVAEFWESSSFEWPMDGMILILISFRRKHRYEYRVMYGRGVGRSLNSFTTLLVVAAAAAVVVVVVVVPRTHTLTQMPQQKTCQPKKN